MRIRLPISLVAIAALALLALPSSALARNLTVTDANIDLRLAPDAALLGEERLKIEYDGHYEDTYVRTPQGWRFKERVHHALLREGQRVTPPAPAQ